MQSKELLEHRNIFLRKENSYIYIFFLTKHDFTRVLPGNTSPNTDLGSISDSHFMFTLTLLTLHLFAECGVKERNKSTHFKIKTLKYLNLSF